MLTFESASVLGVQNIVDKLSVRQRPYPPLPPLYTEHPVVSQSADSCFLLAEPAV